MDQCRLQARINYGLGRAARHLGAPVDICRPTDASSDNWTCIDFGRMAKMEVDPDYGHKRPADIGKPRYYLLGDCTGLCPGDYLRGNQGTFFIASMEPNVGALCEVCNRTLDLLETADAANPDAGGYSTNPDGRTDATDVLLLKGWPASVLTKTRGDTPPSKLPGDVRAAYFEVLLPLVVPIEITQNMRLRDETGQSYEVTTAEKSPQCWRLLVQQENT